MPEGPGYWNSVHVITSYYGYETGIATGNRYRYIEAELQLVLSCFVQVVCLSWIKSLVANKGHRWLNDHHPPLGGTFMLHGFLPLAAGRDSTGLHCIILDCRMQYAAHTSTRRYYYYYYHYYFYYLSYSDYYYYNIIIIIIYHIPNRSPRKVRCFWTGTILKATCCFFSSTQQKNTY